MKAKMLISFLVAAMVIFNSGSRAQTPSDTTNKSADEQIKKVLKDFYTSYITTISKADQGFENKLKGLRNKYCTKKLVNKMTKDQSEGLDYDPLIKGQDSDTEYLKTLSVDKDPKKTNAYTVSYITTYDHSKITIHLLVVKENNNYKMDAVW